MAGSNSKNHPHLFQESVQDLDVFRLDDSLTKHGLAGTWNKNAGVHVQVVEVHEVNNTLNKPQDVDKVGVVKVLMQVVKMHQRSTVMQEAASYKEE